MGGESGGPLELETGVCVEESSDPATSSWGVDAVGVVEGEATITPTPPLPPTAEKLRNMARIESAELAFFWPSRSFSGLLAASPALDYSQIICYLLAL